MTSRSTRSNKKGPRLPSAASVVVAMIVPIDSQLTDTAEFEVVSNTTTQRSTTISHHRTTYERQHGVAVDHTPLAPGRQAGTGGSGLVFGAGFNFDPLTEVAPAAHQINGSDVEDPKGTQSPLDFLDSPTSSKPWSFPPSTSSAGHTPDGSPPDSALPESVSRPRAAPRARDDDYLRIEIPPADGFQDGYEEGNQDGNRDGNPDGSQEGSGHALQGARATPMSPYTRPDIGGLRTGDLTTEDLQDVQSSPIRRTRSSSIVSRVPAEFPLYPAVRNENWVVRSPLEKEKSEAEILAETELESLRKQGTVRRTTAQLGNENSRLTGGERKPQIATREYRFSKPQQSSSSPSNSSQSKLSPSKISPAKSSSAELSPKLSPPWRQITRSSPPVKFDALEDGGYFFSSTPRLTQAEVFGWLFRIGYPVGTRVVMLGVSPSGANAMSINAIEVARIGSSRSYTEFYCHRQAEHRNYRCFSRTFDFLDKHNALKAAQLHAVGGDGRTLPEASRKLGALVQTYSTRYAEAKNFRDQSRMYDSFSAEWREIMHRYGAIVVYSLGAVVKLDASDLRQQIESVIINMGWPSMTRTAAADYFDMEAKLGPLFVVNDGRQQLKFAVKGASVEGKKIVLQIVDSNYHEYLKNNALFNLSELERQSHVLSERLEEVDEQTMKTLEIHLGKVNEGIQSTLKTIEELENSALLWDSAIKSGRLLTVENVRRYLVGEPPLLMDLDEGGDAEDPRSGTTTTGGGSGGNGWFSLANDYELISDLEEVGSTLTMRSLKNDFRVDLSSLETALGRPLSTKEMGLIENGASILDFIKRLKKENVTLNRASLAALLQASAGEALIRGNSKIRRGPGGDEWVVENVGGLRWAVGPNAQVAAIVTKSELKEIADAFELNESEARNLCTSIATPDDLRNIMLRGFASDGGPGCRIFTKDQVREFEREGEIRREVLNTTHTVVETHTLNGADLEDDDLDETAPPAHNRKDIPLQDTAVDRDGRDRDGRVTGGKPRLNSVEKVHEFVPLDSPPAQFAGERWNELANTKKFSYRLYNVSAADIVKAMMRDDDDTNLTDPNSGLLASEKHNGGEAAATTSSGIKTITVEFPSAWPIKIEYKVHGFGDQKKITIEKVHTAGAASGEKPPYVNALTAAHSFFGSKMMVGPEQLLRIFQGGTIAEATSEWTVPEAHEFSEKE